jgi:hypothetical protein
MVFKGLYPNTPSVPEGTFSGEFKMLRIKREKERRNVLSESSTEMPPTFGV